jgi:hypothetical protein
LTFFAVEILIDFCSYNMVNWTSVFKLLSSRGFKYLDSGSNTEDTLSFYLSEQPFGRGRYVKIEEHGEEVEVTIGEKTNRLPEDLLLGFLTENAHLD